MILPKNIFNCIQITSPSSLQHSITEQFRQLLNIDRQFSFIARG